MVFNACVMRLQVIGEQVGKLLFLQPSPLSEYKEIPWLAICDMRNLISHEYSLSLIHISEPTRPY